MDKTQQRIKIAEACGFSVWRPNVKLKLEDEELGYLIVNQKAVRAELEHIAALADTGSWSDSEECDILLKNGKPYVVERLINVMPFNKNGMAVSGYKPKRVLIYQNYDTANGWIREREAKTITPLEHFKKHLPDYLNDLNAMHEAEKVLRRPIYGADTDSIIGNRMHEYAELLNYAIDATAEQRAEAFLRTLGLWED